MQTTQTTRRVGRCCIVLVGCLPFIPCEKHHSLDRRLEKPFTKSPASKPSVVGLRMRTRPTSTNGRVFKAHNTRVLKSILTMMMAVGMAHIDPWVSYTPWLGLRLLAPALEWDVTGLFNTLRTTTQLWAFESSGNVFLPFFHPRLPHPHHQALCYGGCLSCIINSWAMFS